MQREYSPMNSAELMDKVVDVYKKSFWVQMAFAAIISVVGFIAIFVVTFVVTFVVIFAAMTAIFGGFPAIIAAAALVIVLPLFLLWQAFSSSGHILLSRQAFYGYKVTLSGLGVFKVFIRVFTALLAQALLIIPFIIAAIGVIFLFVRMLDFYFFMPTMFVVGFFVALFVLGAGFLVFSNIFSLGIAVAVFERQYFFGTIKRSWQLVKPEFWRILGVRTIWFVVGYGISFSAQGVFYLLGFSWSMISGTIPMGFMGDLFVGFITGFVGPSLVSLAVAPLNGIMQSLIYFNRRMKSEGLDIEIRLGKLAQQ